MQTEGLINREIYISHIKHLADESFEKWDEVVFENPTDVGKKELVKHLVDNHDRTLFVSQSYDINRQWNDCPDIMDKVVFMTYTMFSQIDPAELHDFCLPYGLIIYDEAHHTGAKGYITNVELSIEDPDRKYKVFGMTTHTKRYSDNAEDVADAVFGGHRINGMTFEDAIRNNILPQFDYISALYNLPKDIDDLVASSSLARKIVSDSQLIQVNEEGIKSIIRKHIPEGKRKVVYFVPSIEDSLDAEKLAKDLGYGKVHAINYTHSDKENHSSLESYNSADEASLVCISKFNEGAIPEGTNTVVILRRTTTINIFERQILTALSSAKGKPVVYDFVSNIDNLIYSRKENEGTGRYYAERVKSLCSQSIVVDYARQWTTVFNKIRSLNKNGWTEVQDNLLKKYFPKYGEDVYKYIKGHTKPECIMRAEILGLEFIKEPEKEEATEKKLSSYTFSMEGITDDPTFQGKISVRMIKSFCKEYLYTLKNGRLNESSLFHIIDTQDPKRVEAVKSLADICIRATKINIPEKEKEIKGRQNIFKYYVEGYAKSYNKETKNIVIIDGKAYSGAEADENMKRHKEEEQRKGLTRVGDSYMSEKHRIAGKFGENATEHLLYKIYWRLLMDNYKTDNKSQLMKEYSTEDIIKKIDDLRSSRNPWTEEEIAKAENFSKKQNFYPSLIRRHSDLDILEKAREVKNPKLYSYSQMRTSHFESNFKSFIKKYEEVFDKLRFEEEQKAKRRQIEEENRLKKQQEKKEQAKRLKNLKPTVMIISKKKGQ